MQKERVLIVGLDEPEVSAIRDRLDCITVAYEYLPNIKLVEGMSSTSLYEYIYVTLIPIQKMFAIHSELIPLQRCI
ncbi:hypothetical protein [Fischerella sp. FACHB-380]